jgi:acetoin utilization deacetylase AcuC-like enzyme
MPPSPPAPCRPKAGERVLIDCDVHQGNGTASILRGDDSIFTFSIHGARNFPSTRNRAISTSNCRTAAPTPPTCCA